jgi:ribosomal-protein-alanine N-acetyltransferase
MSIATIAKKIFRTSKSAAASAVQVRAMHPDDLPLVMAIERASFPADACWSPTAFRHAFSIQHLDVGYIAECRGKLAGFSVFHPRGSSLVMDNLAVAPDFRRRGIARLLVNEVSASLKIIGVHRLRCRVRESNLDAQLFLRATGWRSVGILRRPFEDCEEDGIKFRRWIGE